MRWRRILLLGIGLLVVLPIAAIGIFIATFDANGWKPRIQDAVLRNTGRTLSLNGPISLKWSMVPTIEARDVAFANVDGGSRPQMVTAQIVEAEVALLPLLSHRIEIPELKLIKPDILIETTPDGRGNWVFVKPAAPDATPAPAPPAASAPASAPASPPATAAASPTDIAVSSLKLDDGTVTWRNGATGATDTVALNSFDLLESSETSPVNLSAVATNAGNRFEVNGEAGSLARLRDTAARTAWPVKLTVTSDGLHLQAEGQSTTPLELASFSGKASGTLDDLASLQPFAPGITLPSVQGLSFNASIAGTGPPLTRVTDLTLHAGMSDLSAYTPGLMLTQVDIRAPGADQPVAVQAAGSYAGAPLTVSATLGTPGALNGGQPFPVDVSLAVAGATATAKGTLAEAAHLAGADLLVSARIPALAPFAALLRRAVPDLTNIALDTKLAEAPGGLADGIALTQLRLSLPQGEIAGEASVTLARHPTITGNLTSKRIDLDALLAVRLVEPPAPATPAPATPAPATPGVATRASPAVARGNPDLLVSDAPLGLAALRDADANVQLRIGELQTGSQTQRDIAGHLVLKEGKLVLDPLSGTLPAGRMSGRLTIDANPPRPPIALVLRAPGLSLRALALMFGRQSDASGALEVDANLDGAGDSLHAIAASLNGTLGLAMVNGEIDNAFLNRLLGPILTSASLPQSLINPGQIIRGTSALRCFAARLDARGGVANFRALYLDSARVKVSGGGTIRLEDEALSLRLDPLTRLASTGITVPLIVTGTITNPRARIDAAHSVQANVIGLAQSAANLAQVPLGVVSGALGGPERFGTGGDDCANQLAIARGGPGGAQPTAPPSLLAVPANAARKILDTPRNVLRDIFGK